ncbi:hypothetical protein Tco_1127870 [Tanacetum coccineum]
MGVDTGESSHPPKRLREDHGTPSGTSVGSKSMSAIQRLVAGAVLNAKVRVAAIPTLPFVTASVSTTLEHEVGDDTNYVAGPNLYTIRAPQRQKLILFSFRSYNDDCYYWTSMVDPGFVARKTPVKINPYSIFSDSSSAGGADSKHCVFFRILLKAADLSCWWDVVNAVKERNAILEKEWNALDVKVTDLEASVVGKECDLTDLNAQLTSAKSQNDNLVDRVHKLEISSAGLQEKIMVYDNCMEQLEKFQDDRMKVVKNDQVWQSWNADLAEMAVTLRKYSIRTLNTISAGECHLRAGIDHGREGRSLADVAAYNPNAEADFNSAL